MVFWGVFLIVIPAIINAFEERWNLSREIPDPRDRRRLRPSRLLHRPRRVVRTCDRELRFRYSASFRDGQPFRPSGTLRLRPQSDGHRRHRPGRGNRTLHRFVVGHRLRHRRFAAVELADPSAQRRPTCVSASAPSTTSTPLESPAGFRRSHSPTRTMTMRIATRTRMRPRSLRVAPTMPTPTEPAPSATTPRARARPGQDRSKIRP